MADTILDALPRPVRLDEYGAAAALIEQRLVSLPDLVATYTLGSVAAPGISDIDRVAVVQGAGPYPGIWNSLPERVRYIGMHTPFLVDSRTFVEHRWFASLEELELVSGQDLPRLEPPEQNLLGLVAGIEGLVILRLKLAKHEFTRRAKVRPMLCELNNLRHDLRLARLTEDEAAAAWQIARQTTALRSAWWDLGEEERTSRFIQLLSSSASAIDGALSAYAAKHRRMASAQELRLGAEWRNVVLDADGPTVASGVGAWCPPSATRISRRAREICWRLTRYRLQVPQEVVLLLSRVSSGEPGVLEERRARVRLYREFMASHGAGWSSIGLAQVFTS